jgi:hypothetical protein
MVCLATNDAIKKLAKRHGILINEGGEITADIQIPEPNAVSMINEVFDSNLAKFDHLGKLQRRFARMFTYPLRF